MIISLHVRLCRINQTAADYAAAAVIFRYIKEHIIRLIRERFVNFSRQYFSSVFLLVGYGVILH